MSMPADPPDDDGAEGERPVDRARLASLPLGFQRIWEKPLLDPGVLAALTVTNTTLWSTGVAPSCGKPISKIVDPPEEGGDAAR